MTGFRKGRGRDALLARAMAALLVVEDDAAIAEPLVRALEREGHDVALAESGELALRHLDEYDAGRIAQALAADRPVDAQTLDAMAGG